MQLYSKRIAAEFCQAEEKFNPRVSIELNEFDALVRNGDGKTRLITIKIRMTNIITIMMMMVTMMM